MGIVVGLDTDQASITAVQNALRDAGVVPLVVGPRGGHIGSVVVERTYANASSIEFDAVVVVGDTPPGKDAVVSLDAKAGTGNGSAGPVDPRVAKLIDEVWRHAKAIGSVDDAPAVVPAGVPDDAPGVAVGNPTTVAAEIIELLGSHRAWERFATAPA